MSYDNKEEQVTLSLDSYQPSQALKKNKLDFDSDDATAPQSGASYRPMGEVISYDNPIYETDLTLPGEAIGEPVTIGDEEKKDLSLDDSDYI